MKDRLNTHEEQAWCIGPTTTSAPPWKRTMAAKQAEKSTKTLTMGSEASESSDEAKQAKSVPAHCPGPAGEALRCESQSRKPSRPRKWRNARTTPRKPRTIPLLGTGDSTSKQAPGLAKFSSAISVMWGGAHMCSNHSSAWILRS